MSCNAQCTTSSNHPATRQQTSTKHLTHWTIICCGERSCSPIHVAHFQLIFKLLSAWKLLSVLTKSQPQQNMTLLIWKVDHCHRKEEQFNCCHPFYFQVNEKRKIKLLHCHVVDVNHSSFDGLCLIQLGSSWWL